MISRIKVEDYCNLLCQVKQLYQQVDINTSSVLYQYKYKLNNTSTETLRGIAYELLSTLNIDSQQTPFHSDICNPRSRQRRKLSSYIIYLRDKATARRYKIDTLCK